MPEPSDADDPTRAADPTRAPDEASRAESDSRDSTTRLGPGETGAALSGKGEPAGGAPADAPTALSPTQSWRPEPATGPSPESPDAPETPADLPADLPEIPDHEILERIGRGGMGVVLKARHTVLDRMVAIKLPLSGHWADEEDRERFLREARATAKLRHPNLCPVYEVGQAGERPYITMAYIEGQTLARWARDRRPSAREAAEMVARLARAVAYAHEHGVLHRDIKPGNVMVDGQSGEPVLMDFGLAKELSRQGSDLTQSGQVMGTPAYMAPEQAAGRVETIGTPSDVYALGTVLYYLLCGRAPFEGSTGEVLRQVQTDQPAAPRKLAPRTHRDLETICLKAMAREPAARYGSAAALAEDLGRFCAGEAILARREGIARKAWRRVRRRPITVALSLVLLAAVAISGRFALKARQAGALQQQFDEALAADRFAPDEVAEMETIAAKLEKLDPRRAETDRRRLAAQWAAAIRRTIRQPRFDPAQTPTVEAELDRLARHDADAAGALRDELEKRVLDWQPLFELAPPFDEAASVLGEQVVQRDDAGLISPGRLVKTRHACPARARLAAEFDENWPSAGPLTLRLGAKSRGPGPAGGYAFRLVPATEPRPGSAAPEEDPGAAGEDGSAVEATLAILRGDEPLREEAVKLAPRPLLVVATRNADRLALQAGPLPAIEFLDAFPVPAEEDRVFALEWPRKVRLTRLRASVQPLSPAASPLERGDQLFAESRLADALAEYQKQAIASGISEFGQEARVKQAMCLAAMGQLAEAESLLGRLATEPGERWPLVAGCRLWDVRLKLEKVDEAYAAFEALTLRFTPAQVRPLVSARLVEQIVAHYHEGAQGPNLFLYSPDHARDLKRGQAVLEFFGRRGTTLDVTRYLVCRAHLLQGEVKEALDVAERLVADDSQFAGQKTRWLQTYETYAWLLRLEGRADRAVAVLDEQLLEPSGEYRQENLPLLLERARARVALGDYDRAERDVKDFLDRQPPKRRDYRYHAAAWLLLGFLCDRQGDADGALEAWRTGVPGGDPRYPWESVRSVEGFAQSLALATLTGQMTAEDVDGIIERIVSRISMSINPSVIKGTMRIFLMDLTPERMAKIVREAGNRPRARELSRQVAFRELPLDKLIRGAVVLTAAQLADEMLFEGRMSPEQEQLVAELAHEFHAAYFEGRLSRGQIMQLIFAWRGLTNTVGWAGVAPALEPPLRGPLAYLLGHRLSVLGQQDQAIALFRTAADDAEPDSLLRRLTEAELERLGAGPEAAARSRP